MRIGAIVRYEGERWCVSEVDLQRPNLGAQRADIRIVRPNGRGSLIGYRVCLSAVEVIEEQPTFEVGQSVTLPSDASDGVVVSDIGGDEVRCSSTTRRDLRGEGRIAVPGFCNVPRDSLVLANRFLRR
jgi:hypothetical protein